MKERRELGGHRGRAVETQQPLPGIDRVVVVGADERLREIVQRSMRMQHAVEEVPLGVPIAASDRALAAVQDLERERVAGVRWPVAG